MSEARQYILLGPQRLAPTAGQAVDQLAGKDRRPVAVITAGWEEREAEDQELGEHLQRDIVNLRLHERAEAVMRSDGEVAGALRRRYDRLCYLQELYRVRLRHMVPAAQELLQKTGDPALLEPEREAAFAALQTMDGHHMQRVSEINAACEAKWHLQERPEVTKHRQELAQQLTDCSAICIAGGHVGILFNRLWLFDILSMLGSMPVVAWSAGAMCLTSKLVLFHDDPPQGGGFAEVYGPGLGPLNGVVLLPHASRRLHLDDSVRVTLLARRFPNDYCVVLDDNTGIHYDGNTWKTFAETQQLCPSTGELVEFGSSLQTAEGSRA